jgi:hypothetical protein
MFLFSSADGHSARLQEAGCKECGEHVQTVGEVSVSLPHFFGLIGY